ncbi:MAG: metallophosphoesterase family protein [Candidatus Omnitrophota bacterium]
MRYGIFSDVHSNLEALNAVINAYKKEKIDKYLCAGDIVGYGANLHECIAKIKSLVSASVAGNHDRCCAGLFSEKNFSLLAKQAVIWTKKVLAPQEKEYLESLKLTYTNEDLTLVHGSLDTPFDFNYIVNNYDAYETFRLLKTRVCFIGHTHARAVFSMDKNHVVYRLAKDLITLEPDKKYIINAGSVGQPRDGNPKASYCIYDTEKSLVEIKRVSYDARLAGRKIISAGLPHFLADRILSGI